MNLVRLRHGESDADEERYAVLEVQVDRVLGFDSSEGSGADAEFNQRVSEFFVEIVGQLF